MLDLQSRDLNLILIFLASVEQREKSNLEASDACELNSYVKKWGFLLGCLFFFFFSFSVFFTLFFLTVIFDASLVILQREECSTTKLSCNFQLGLLRTVLHLLQGRTLVPVHPNQNVLGRRIRKYKNPNTLKIYRSFK